MKLEAFFFCESFVRVAGYRICKMPQSEQAFILHVWREKNNGAFTWRGSLTDARSGVKTYFQSLPGLMELIEKLLGAMQPEKGDQTEEKRNV